MDQASPSTQTAPAVSSRSLRVVLFGMPKAGKSSLLGALAQAAQTQEHIFNGRILDKSQRLLELQRRLYEGRPRETLEEVAAYDIALQPLGGKPGEPTAGTVNATLIDCDGRVANELLARDDLNGTGRALARSVLNADTLVLVVDASTDAGTLKQTFGQFAQFLRALEMSRGERTEVGGLPVYLVLTKCDLLAQKTDTTAAWMDRIEERKREVSQRFKDFLAVNEGSDGVPFGKVELNVWATAVKRPALADAPARPVEPYGVAELFRQCLESAAAYRERRTLASRRLLFTLGVAGGVVVALVLLMLVLVLSQPSKEATALNDEVRRYIAANDRPAERFQNIDDKLEQLKHFKDSPDFARLPEDYRAGRCRPEGVDRVQALYRTGARGRQDVQLRPEPRAGRRRGESEEDSNGLEGAQGAAGEVVGVAGVSGGLVLVGDGAAAGPVARGPAHPGRGEGAGCPGI